MEKLMNENKIVESYFVVADEEEVVILISFLHFSFAEILFLPKNLFLCASK